jgi:outer membrane protein assembly factor BamB
MKKTTLIHIILLSCILSTPSLFAENWPTYRANPERSGFISQTLPTELNLQWTYNPAHTPQPAWQGRDTRMSFDYAYQTVIADGRLYFGSSADCKIYALNARTGEEEWSIITDAPVRFAPVFWNNRVYAVSDDGFLYCLNASDGKEIWQRRGGSDAHMILGNDHMVSKWPARGGAAIKDGIVYFAAGIWPSEGIFIYALDAKTGDVIWLNDKSGGMEMDQPHSTARAKSGVSAQGYLVASQDKLFIPTGRAVPAAFDRNSGDFQYFHLQANRAEGGSCVMTDGPLLFNSGIGFNAQSGLPQIKTSKLLAKTQQGIVQASKDKVSIYQWCITEKKDRKGKPFKIDDLKQIASIDAPFSGVSLICAGNTIVSGGKDGVCLIDRKTNTVKKKISIKGMPYGLAVADNRLYISTEKGTIYCFGIEKTDAPKIVFNKPDTKQNSSNKAKTAAEQIINKTGVTNGFCLDLQCGDGSLALELAKQTNLQIYATDSNIENVKKARQKLDQAGLYGVRVTVHHADPNQTNYPDYFANLVVSGQALHNGENPSINEMQRLQRPYGGIVYLAKSDSGETLVRGALEGASNWSHQYFNTANTCCSTDQLVKGPLGMLWFRDSDQIMPSRHGRGPAPLFYNGTMFVEGMNTLRAIDAYNGRTLWEYQLEGILKSYDQEHLMGTAGTGSNFCVSEDAVYIRQDNLCFCIDSSTGKKIREFSTEQITNSAKDKWGYIAYVNGTLLGSVLDQNHIVKWRYLKGDMSEQFTESHTLFALDAKTGETKWSYKAKDSIRHNSIAANDKYVYLIDRELAEIDRIDYEKAKRREGDKTEAKTPIHNTGVLLALDIENGSEIWREENNIYGTMLALSMEYDALLMSYQPTRFRLSSEIGGKMTAFNASSGKRLWDKPAEYGSRPLINGAVIYAQPSAWNLLSGDKLPFEFSRSYGCGTLAGSTNMLVYRSATLGYRDLQKDKETQNYGGIRPACWINAIPAGGLLLMPNATDRCTCSYLNTASVALQELK